MCECMSILFLSSSRHPRDLHSFPTRRSSDLRRAVARARRAAREGRARDEGLRLDGRLAKRRATLGRSEEHTSELQSRQYLVCRLLLEKKKKKSILTRFKQTRLQYARHGKQVT